MTSSLPSKSLPSKSRAITVAGLWGALVTAVLAVVPLALRDRLPDPLATHWSGGSLPDGNASFAGSLAFVLIFWGATWAALLGAALHGAILRGRLSRVHWWGLLFGGAVFTLGMHGVTLAANLDAATWREALLPGWQIVAVLAASAGAGVLAGYLGRGGPDVAPARSRETPVMRLRPGQRAVWVSRVSNPWLAGLTTVSLLSAAVVCGFAAMGMVGASAAWMSLAVAVPLTLLGLATATVQVRTDAEGLRVGFGPWGRPARRTPIGAIESAWAERLTPAEVGGWGVRGIPGTGRTTLMLRGGDHLVVRRTGGGEFAVSADDAERGAALLNAYIAETTGS
ncbi:DUF1648 domain-containing protein [Planomonospora venezuelensis]|uniref:DUF1648 domain-containing protein n=1 Tax=Planomonospora venezuelensis TaxID=1999 RepID=A0A841CZL1_PLAVE|nr:DUF1648 domain-containing protein [Planomonospora venezuelensis]MBB5961734.1 hypothetical protein [Planomonospora venezuelensis]GIM98881.1 hypothetical protein Pve01_05400 [Planomonospora venezuelensis]